MTTYIQNIITLSGSRFSSSSLVEKRVKRAILKAVGPNPDETQIKRQPTLKYKIVFPFGPNDMQFQQHNGRYSSIDRPFKKPLNIFVGGSLRVVTFEAVIANRLNGGLTPDLSNNAGETVQDVLDTLEAISQTGATCDFIYGVTRLPFKTFLTEFSYTVTRRDFDGQPIRASVSIQLTEKIEYNPDTRILPMIVRPPVNLTPTGGGSPNVDDPIDKWHKTTFSGDAGAAAGRLRLQLGLEDTGVSDIVTFMSAEL